MTYLHYLHRDAISASFTSDILPACEYFATGGNQNGLSSVLSAHGRLIPFHGREQTSTVRVEGDSTTVVSIGVEWRLQM